MAASIVSCLIVSCSMDRVLDLVFICEMVIGSATGIEVAVAFFSASIFFCKRVYTMVIEVVVCCPR